MRKKILFVFNCLCFVFLASSISNIFGAEHPLLVAQYDQQRNRIWVGETPPRLNTVLRHLNDFHQDNREFLEPFMTNGDQYRQGLNQLYYGNRFFPHLDCYEGETIHEVIWNSKTGHHRQGSPFAVDYTPPKGARHGCPPQQIREPINILLQCFIEHYVANLTLTIEQ